MWTGNLETTDAKKKLSAVGGLVLVCGIEASTGRRDRMI